MKYSKLFSPIQIRGVTFPNRVIQSAMGTLMVGVDKKINQTVTDFLTARAKGGVGLVYSQCCGVDDNSTPEGFLCIGTDEQGDSHKMLTRSIHEVGGKVGIQLLQGAICAAPAKIYVPSDMPGFDGSIIHGMSVEDIHYIVEAFRKAAHRAVEAGYDIIEIHCAHGYLQYLFMNPTTNRREDEYGGSFENRFRFAFETIAAVRSQMPDDMPLAIRIPSKDEGFDSNIPTEELVEFSKRAKGMGVDLLSISRGNCLTWSTKLNVPPVDIPQGFNVEDGARIHDETGMLTAIAGRINHPQMAEDILEAGKADMVVMARAQIADPEFCIKAKEGRDNEIVYCIGCDQGCYDPHMNPANYTNDVHITCLRNPAVGREREYEFKKTSSPKRVLIAGGGMGGMEAAYRLKMLGHEPVLCEAGDHLGGQFILAGETPRKGEFKQAAFDCAARLERVGAEVRLNTPVTEELINELKPDYVIIAIGAEPINIKLPGMEKKPVYNSHEVLARKAKPEGVVGIIGGGMVGLETSELIASYGNKVKVIEMQPELAADMGVLRKMCTLGSMAEEGIETFVGTKCVSVNDEGIVAEQSGEKIVIPCDSIVTAVGARSRKTAELTAVCEKLGIPCKIIGDALQARRALNATADGAAAAYEINKL